MTTYSVGGQVGRIQAAEGDAIWKPRVIRGSDKYGLVYCHGAGGTWTQPSSASWPGIAKLMAYAARNGIPAITGDLGLDTVGNATGVARVDAARVALAAATGCSSAKVHLAGASMGPAVALEYAINNPTKVASITGFIPLTSIVNGHKTNPPTGTEANAAGNFTQLFATAWGTTYRTFTDGVTNGTTTLTSPAGAAFVPGDVGKLLVSKAANGIPAGTTIQAYVSATQVTMSAAASTSGSGRIIGIAQTLPAGADILAQAGVLQAAGIPVRLYYAPDDTLITPADVTALAAAIGPTATATATAGGGHTNLGAGLTTFDFDDWVAWLKANGG